MTTLAISVALYSSDLTLLNEITDSFPRAFMHASRSSALICGWSFASYVKKSSCQIDGGLKNESLMAD